MAKPKLLSVSKRVIKGIVRRVAAEPRDRKQARIGRKLARLVVHIADIFEPVNIQDGPNWDEWKPMVKKARELLAVGKKQGGG